MERFCFLKPKVLKKCRALNDNAEVMIMITKTYCANNEKLFFYKFIKKSAKIQKFYEIIFKPVTNLKNNLFFLKMLFLVNS